MELFILTLILVALAMIGLAIRLLLLKGGRFPDTHVGHNPRMKKLGITCARNESCLCRGMEPKKRKRKSPDVTGNVSQEHTPEPPDKMLLKKPPVSFPAPGEDLTLNL